MPRSFEEIVREKYGAVAASTLSNGHAGVRSVAEAFGYSAEELASIPPESNMAFSPILSAKTVKVEHAVHVFSLVTRVLYRC
jgi:hypothetical protein